MAEKDLNEVSKNWRELFRKGSTSLSLGDADTSIAAFNQILEAEPGLVVCREALRRAQLLRAQENNGSLQRAIGEVRELPELAEAEACLHIKPVAAIRAAENVLNRSPNCILAHKILARAALKANLPRTALLSLNFIYSRITESLDITLELVAALMRIGHTEEALSICGRLQKDYPTNRRVLRVLGVLAKNSFDEHTNQMSSAAASPRMPPAANYGFGKNWGFRRNRSIANTRG